MGIKVIIRIIFAILFFLISTQLYYPVAQNKPTKDKSYIFNNRITEVLSLPEMDKYNKLEPKIVILDTGIDFNNPLLSKCRYMDIDLTNDLNIKRIHGTEVAGVIASDGKKVTGLLNNAKLISIRVGDENGWSTNKLAQGLELAINLKPDVINVSGGTATNDIIIQKLVEKATFNNIIIVASAGNNASEYCDYPAAYSQVLSVGAIDNDYNIAANSNFGKLVKVFAPGEDILTTSFYTNKIETTTFSGTSAAAPFVTCLAAILKLENPNMSVEQIVDRILNTSDSFFSKGHIIKIINYEKALSK